MHSLAGRTIISAHTSTSEIFIFIKTSICINSNDKFIVPTSDTSIPQYAKIQKPRYMLFVFNILSFCKISNSSNDGGSYLGWCGLWGGTKCRKYCNKQALICNKLRSVSKIGVDTPSHKASVFVKLRRDKSAVQAQVLSKKSEQQSSFIHFRRGR